MKRQSYSERLDQMTASERIEEFKRLQHKKEIVIKISILCCIGSAICTTLVLLNNLF